MTLRYGVFLSHKQSEAKDFARALYTLFESRDVRCFLDMEFRDDLNDLEELVAASSTLLFVLTDHVLESEWCLKELAAAVKNNVKIVMVVKEARAVYSHTTMKPQFVRSMLHRSPITSKKHQYYYFPRSSSLINKLSEKRVV